MPCAIVIEAAPMIAYAGAEKLAIESLIDTDRLEPDGPFGESNGSVALEEIVIAVSENIEPAHTDDVMGSLAYRSNPGEEVHLEPYPSTGHAPKSGPVTLVSTLLVDATLKHSMVPLALPRREFMEQALARWKDLGLPKLTVQSPWYGYSPGDRTDAWETGLPLTPSSEAGSHGQEHEPCKAASGEAPRVPSISRPGGCGASAERNLRRHPMMPQSTLKRTTPRRASNQL